jgi:hypothetical protein
MSIEGQVRTPKKPDEQGALTYCQAQREVQVRTLKGTREQGALTLY